MYEHVSERLLPFREFVWRLVGHAGVIAAVVAGSLGVGMVGYRTLAPMPWVDAFLNAAMILGGMGPVESMPQERHNEALKLFAGLYALYGGLVFVAALGIIMAPVIHRLLHRLHAEEDES